MFAVPAGSGSPKPRPRRAGPGRGRRELGRRDRPAERRQVGRQPRQQRPEPGPGTMADASAGRRTCPASAVWYLVLTGTAAAPSSDEGEPGQRERGLVRQQHRHPVAGPDAAVAQRLRVAGRQAVHVGEGQRSPGSNRQATRSGHRLGRGADRRRPASPAGPGGSVRSSRPPSGATVSAAKSTSAAIASSSAQSAPRSRACLASARASARLVPQPGRDLGRDLLVLARRSDLVHQPSSSARAAPNRSPSSSSSFARTGPTSSGSSREMPPVTLRPDRHLGKPELRVLGRHHQVAAERELAAGPEGVAVHGRDDRAGEPADRPGHVLDLLDPQPGGQHRLRRQRLLQVVPGAERPAPARQHDHPGAVLAGPGQGRDQAGGQFRHDRVEPVRAVQVDPRHRLGSARNRPPRQESFPVVVCVLPRRQPGRGDPVTAIWG